jgi:hypothetical protein
MSTQMVVNRVATTVPGSLGWTPMTVHLDNGALSIPLRATLYPRAVSLLTVSWTEPTVDGAAAAMGANAHTAPARAATATVMRAYLFIVEPFVERAVNDRVST